MGKSQGVGKGGADADAVAGTAAGRADGSSPAVLAGDRARRQALRRRRSPGFAVKMLPLYEAVNIPSHQQLIDENGVLHATELMQAASDAMLEELARTHQALGALREGQSGP